jgi:hypothetical protein
MPDDPECRPDEQDPGYASVRDFLLYGISLPERALRSASGVVSGALRESASLLVPQAFRNSKTYNVMIQQMLDLLAEDVGGVQRPDDPHAPPKVENYVARKAVGNFVEMAGLATFHLSPMLLLAVISDLAYGSQAYLQELAEDLKRQGVIDQQSTVDDVDDLLAAVAGATKTAATAFDTPPLSVDGLRQTIDQTRAAVRAIDPTKIIPQSEVRRLWDEIRQTATSQGVNPLAVSSAMTLYSLGKIGSLGRGALSTVKAAGTLLDRHVIDHYADALCDIRRQGIYASLAQSGRPYIDAVWRNFSTDRTTVTQDIVSGRLLGQAWGAARRWLGGGTGQKAGEQRAMEMGEGGRQKADGGRRKAEGGSGKREG